MDRRNLFDIENAKFIEKNILPLNCNIDNIGTLLNADINNVKVIMNDKSNFIFIKNSKAKISFSYFFIEGKNNVIEIDENCKIDGTYFIIRGNNNLINIGKDTTINGSFWGVNYIHCGGEHKSISIGADCMLSGGILIRNTDGHSIIKDGKRINPNTNLSIGQHTWICMKATILKNGNLGKNCIVGANSVVTKSFNDKSIIAGNPAKLCGGLENGNWERKTN